MDENYKLLCSSLCSKVSILDIFDIFYWTDILVCQSDFLTHLALDVEVDNTQSHWKM